MEFDRTVQPPNELSKCPACSTAVPGPSERLVLTCPTCASSFLRGPGSEIEAEAGPKDEGASDELLLDAEFLENFELLRLLGAGGAGRVYLAKDKRSWVQVAIKFMLNLADPSVSRRFQREGKLLSQVHHPNVVRLNEVGTLPGGQPFLVSEYVEGGTLKRRLKAGRIPIGEAIWLMLEVLEGVIALHANGVVHRDLKPDNILLDAGGRPRITDLGLARQENADGTSLTATGAILGTPRYMSPEQVRGLPTSTASDIYALGMIFHELLTGRTPFEATSYFELMQMHVEEKPAPLRKLLPDAPVELEVLLARALEKEPERRPASALEMADAIRTAVQASRQRARRRTVLVTTGAVLLVSVAAAVAAGRLPGRATTTTPESPAGPASASVAPPSGAPSAEEWEAQGRALLARGRNAEALEPLAKARDMFAVVHGPDAEQVASVASLIGRAQQALGHVDLARNSFNEALAARTRSFGADSLQASENLADLGGLELSAGRADAAIEKLEACLAVRVRKRGPEHPEVANMQLQLGKAQISKGDVNGGEKRLRAALAIWQKSGGAEDLPAASCLNMLAWLETSQGKYTEALAHYNQALTILKQKLSPEHTDLAGILSNTATVYRHLHDDETALKLMKQALSIIDRAGARQGPAAAQLLINMGDGYIAMSRGEEATPLLLEAVSSLRRLYGTDHPAIALGLFNLGRAYGLQDKVDEAEASLREALAIQARLLPATHPDRLRTVAALAFTLVRANRLERAAPLTRDLIDLSGEGFTAAYGEFVGTLDQLAGRYEVAGQLPLALALYQRALAFDRQLFGAEDDRAAVAAARVARTLDRMGRHPEAAQLFARLLQSWKAAGRRADAPIVSELRLYLDRLKANHLEAEAGALEAELGGLPAK